MNVALCMLGAARESDKLLSRPLRVAFMSHSRSSCGCYVDQFTYHLPDVTCMHDVTLLTCAVQSLSGGVCVRYVTLRHA